MQPSIWMGLSVTQLPTSLANNLAIGASSVYARRASRVAQHGGMVDEVARGLDLRAHVGDQELDALEVGDGLAELMSDLGILHGVLVRALRHTEGQRAGRDAAAGERAHECLEAARRLAEHLIRRNEAVLEHHFHG